MPLAKSKLHQNQSLPFWRWDKWLRKTCLLSVGCTAYRWHDLDAGSFKEREKQVWDDKRKCRKRRHARQKVVMPSSVADCLVVVLKFL